MARKKEISPPDLDKYLEGRKHRYVSYKEGAIMYELVESIKANGVLTPILVRPDDEGTYEMISGH